MEAEATKYARKEGERDRLKQACEHGDVSACVQAFEKSGGREEYRKDLMKIACAMPGIKCRTLVYADPVEPETFPGEKTLYTAKDTRMRCMNGEMREFERTIFYLTSTDEKGK
jgi:hypothetical protein